ncbi:hypothetical protein L7F22_058052 [Adiantum nelumboides]|nr:hypothetical protein [Adiantum nelumboides]
MSLITSNSCNATSALWQLCLMALITSRPAQAQAPTGPGLIDFYSQDTPGGAAQSNSQGDKLEENNPTKNLWMQPSVWREKHYQEAKMRGTAMYKFIEARKVSIHSTKKQLAQIEKRMGSRPPLCSNKCNACNPCEAVQVPTPLLRPSRSKPGPKKKVSTASDPRTFVHVEYSNYQPEGWKCKCGSLIYNP